MRKLNEKKRYKKGVGEFEYNLEKELFKIKRELENLSYKSSRPEKFVLREPKKRTIFVVDFKDRVIHHALCNIIEPIFDKSFIKDSYACQKEKGTHRAVWRLEQFQRKVTKNNTRKGYILKADVRKYFDSIDHEILLKIIKRKIKDRKVMWLIEEIVRSHEGKGDFKGKGVPIGNLTSQLFANVYLNELDYFVKEKLRAKYYIRYMDDLVILSPSIDFLLEVKEKINEFLTTWLNLKLHPKKSWVFPPERGVDFLGYQIFYYYKLLKKGAVKRIKEKLKVLAETYNKEFIDLSEIYGSVVAWLGYSKHADTYKLRERLLENLIFLVKI